MSIPLYESEARTCMTCAWGRYHASRPGGLESPPEPAYCECAHPRVCCEPYNPATHPARFDCRYWTVQPDGSDAAGLDADVLPFDVWLTHWKVTETGELVPA